MRSTQDYSANEIHELQTQHFYLARRSVRKATKLVARLDDPPLELNGPHNLYHWVIQKNKQYKSPAVSEGAADSRMRQMDV